MLAAQPMQNESRIEHNFISNELSHNCRLPSLPWRMAVA